MIAPSSGSPIASSIPSKARARKERHSSVVSVAAIEPVSMQDSPLALQKCRNHSTGDDRAARSVTVKTVTKYGSGAAPLSPAR